MVNKSKPRINREIQQYLERFLAIIGETARVKTEQQIPNEIYVNVEQPLKYLPSVDAQVTKSLSDFLEIVLKRKFDLDYSVCLDVNGEKNKKRAKLKQFALRAADKAKDKKTRIRLNPMPPQDRKFIHITLDKLEGVNTYSVGRGKERRVVIEPAREKPNN